MSLLAIVALALIAGLFSTSLRAQPKKAKATVAPLPNPNPTTVKAPFSLAGPIVGRAVGFAETQPLRELAESRGTIDSELSTPEAEEINPFNSSDLARPSSKAPAQYDGALQATWTPKNGFSFQPRIPSPIVTFDGVPVQSSAPPDTTGAVGPNDYVQCVNVQCRIFDKNGVPRGPSFKLNTLFASLGGVAANTNNGDPIVLYDRLANRWILSQFAFASSTVPPFHQPIAVSKTGDPTGAYWVYDFIVPGNDFPDYGKFGVWPDGYYFTDRQFTAPSSTYNGFGAYAFDRAKMLVGDSSASFIYFNAGPNLSQASSGMIPTDFYGLTPPPAGAPNVFAVYTDDASGDPSDALRLFDFHADFTVPANSTFIERPESPLPVAAFDARNPSGRADIEEPAPATTSDYLDSIGDRLMLRLMYINRGGLQLLTTCHTVNAGTIPPVGVSPTTAEYKAGTRWYVLQRTSPSANWSVQDQGTFSPDANERWMGSTSLDNAGNLAVGYSISSTSVFPSLAYAGRLLGDPAGTLNQGEATLFAGTGVQQATSNRWGDYSNMSLDPTDDSTFWFTSEYYATSGQFLWRTRIGSFKFPNTTAPAQGTLSGTVTACDTGAPIKDALVMLSGGPSTGFSSATTSAGTYSLNVAPGNYTVTITDPAHLCTAAGPFNVTITNGGTTTQNACLTGAPRFVFNTQTLSPSGGNGNGIVEPNECNKLDVAILNDGCLIGKNVSAVLSSSTAGVTVTQPNSPYNDTVENGTSTNLVPFVFSTSSTFACGTTISFTLTVKYDGGTTSFPFTIQSCNTAPLIVNGALTSSDPQQPNGRLGRNGVSSVCGTAKACPGALGTGNRIYRTHSFTNGPAAACVTIKTTQGCPTTANDIIPAAYLNSYDPNNFCTNYLGDPGGSPGATPNSFSVDVPANATLVVVVQEANSGLAGCSSYQLMVSGLVGTGVGGGTCPPAPTAVSRKSHGSAGTFDIPMPLTGATGVEDRATAGGVHRIVVTYPTSPAGAVATVVQRNPSGATGNVSTTSVSGNDLIVDLTGVSNAQILMLSISGGTNISPAVVPLGFLIGDVNADRLVNSGDVTITRNASGQPLTSGNFRADVNPDGTINSADVTLTRNNSGAALP